MGKQPFDAPGYHQQPQQHPNAKEQQDHNVAAEACTQTLSAQKAEESVLYIVDPADKIMIISQHKHDHGTGNTGNDHGPGGDEPQRHSQRCARKVDAELRLFGGTRQMRQYHHNSHHEHKEHRPHKGELLPLHVTQKHGQAPQDHADKSHGCLEGIVGKAPDHYTGKQQHAQRNADHIGDHKHNGLAADVFIPAGDGNSLFVNTHGQDHGTAADPGDQNGQADKHTFNDCNNVLHGPILPVFTGKVNIRPIKKALEVRSDRLRKRS